MGEGESSAVALKYRTSGWTMTTQPEQALSHPMGGGESFAAALKCRKPELVGPASNKMRLAENCSALPSDGRGSKGEGSRLVVVWRVTQKCNLSCPFCSYDRRV